MVNGKLVNDNKEKVKTTKIKEGMIIKNYKVFCDLVGEKVKAGVAKQVQIKRWERFIQFEKIPRSQAYHIIKVYDRPLPKMDKRKDRELRGGRYKKYIEFLLMQTLAHSISGSVRTSKKHFFNFIGLLPPVWSDIFTDVNTQVQEVYDKNREERKRVENQKDAATQKAIQHKVEQGIEKVIGELRQECGDIVDIVDIKTAIKNPKPNYIQFDYYQELKNVMVQYLKEHGDSEEEVAFMEQIPIYNVRTFSDRVNNKVRSVFQAAIASMENHKLIRVTEDFNVTRDTCNGGVITYKAGIYVDRENDIEYDENEVVNESLTQVLNKMGFENLSQARLRHKLQDVYDELDEYLYENYGILNAYHQIRLAAKVKDFDKINVLGDISIADAIKLLNQELIEGLRRQTVSQHNKVIAEYMGGYCPMDKKYKVERAEDTYVDNQNFLIDHFLKITNEEAERLASEIEAGINVVVSEYEKVRLEHEEKERKQEQEYQEFYKYYGGNKYCVPKQNSENEDEYNDGD